MPVVDHPENKDNTHICLGSTHLSNRRSQTGKLIHAILSMFRNGDHGFPSTWQ